MRGSPPTSEFVKGEGVEKEWKWDVYCLAFRGPEECVVGYINTFFHAKPTTPLLMRLWLDNNVSHNRKERRGMYTP
jgi:hypothetical protein